ncbi:SbtR family transcriptional regulator [Sphingopyxis sp.]|uniref:SbtR family transcriptional regulator n=1 Tax=Sphingopyxis sp. TaxID=1908224 RepID=UPI003FA7AE5B
MTRASTNASCAAVHSASARLLHRAQAEGSARTDMNGDDAFALMSALGWAVDQPSFAPRADHLIQIIVCAILTNAQATVAELRRKRAPRMSLPGLRIFSSNCHFELSTIHEAMP